MATDLQKPLKLKLVREAPEASCPICDRGAKTYTVEGLLDGYIEACPDHAQRIAQDALDHQFAL